MAPATGYAEASSDKVRVRNIENMPDIGQATSYYIVNDEQLLLHSMAGCNIRAKGHTII